MCMSNGNELKTDECKFMPLSSFNMTANNKSTSYLIFRTLTASHNAKYSYEYIYDEKLASQIDFYLISLDASRRTGKESSKSNRAQHICKRDQETIILGLYTNDI